MKTFKEITLVFFAGLGIHHCIQDVFNFLDPGSLNTNDSGYFSISVFVILYFTIRYLKKRDEEASAGDQTSAG